MSICPYVWGDSSKPEQGLDEVCPVCGSTGADIGIYGGAKFKCKAYDAERMRAAREWLARQRPKMLDEAAKGKRK